MFHLVLGSDFNVAYTLAYFLITGNFTVLKETKKTLVLREMPEQSVKELLSSKTSLAACDVAVFVYDR